VLSFQPSEAAKLALILFLAYHLENCGERIEKLRSLAGGGLILAALSLLVLGGRDLGTVISMVLIAAAVLFAAGLKLRYFAAGAAMAAPVIAAAIYHEPYRLKRLLIFLDPESDPQGAGFQIIQSKIAVGTGGWLGQGLMLGRQKMHFLPEAHTDFIFAAVGEELGLIGCLAVMLGFAAVLWRGLRTAMRAPDGFGRYLAVGVTAMIVCQAMINMGVVLALLPTKGMTLPFISYGGSAMITCLAGAGMLLNVSQYAEG
jgi:cell division protein FtsW